MNKYKSSFEPSKEAETESKYKTSFSSPKEGESMNKYKSNSQSPRGRKSPLNGNSITAIDYKDVELLKQFTTERGKILPRRITNVTATQQRYITNAIKRARCIALMPFVSTE
jgi:small subunit ribosomal protein S18